MYDDPASLIYAECPQGTGRVIAFTSRGRTKKIIAILLIGKRFVDVPLADLKHIRAPRKK